MVSLRSRSPSAMSEIEVSSPSREEETRRKRRPKTEEGLSRRRRSAKEEDLPKRRRQRSSPKEKARDLSPLPLRRKSARSPKRRRSSPEASTRSRHRDEGGKKPEEGFGYRALSRALPDSGRRRRRSSPNKEERDADLEMQDERSRNALERAEKSRNAIERAEKSRNAIEGARNAIQKAVQSGAAPKRSSRKVEVRASEEDIDGEPVLEVPANRRQSAGVNAAALDIVGYDIDGEPTSEGVARRPSTNVAADSDGEPDSQPSPDVDLSASEEQMHGDVDRQSAPESNEPTKKEASKPRSEILENDQERQERRQERETFQERLRRKQMERSNKPEVQPDRNEPAVKVAPDKSALQVAALAIKAAAAAGAASADREETQEDSPEAGRPLTIPERTRKCAERAAALGLSCDFVNGRLLPADRARQLIDVGRRRRRGEHVDDIDLPPLPCEVPPPLPKTEPSPPVDPETVVRAAEASEAAFSFEAFLAARSRAVAAPPKLAPVSDQLQQRIAVAAITRAKKEKRKRRGRDFDYDPDVDGDSMESSEERRCMDELDGSSMDSSDEREALICPPDWQLHEKNQLGRTKTLVGPDIFM